MCGNSRACRYAPTNVLRTRTRTWKSGRLVLPHNHACFRTQLRSWLADGTRDVIFRGGTIWHSNLVSLAIAFYANSKVLKGGLFKNLTV